MAELIIIVLVVIVVTIIKRWKNTYPAKRNCKKVGVAKLITR